MLVQQLTLLHIPTLYDCNHPCIEIAIYMVMHNCEKHKLRAVTDLPLQKLRRTTKREILKLHEFYIIKNCQLNKFQRHMYQVCSILQTIILVLNIFICRIKIYRSP